MLAMRRLLSAGIELAVLLAVWGVLTLVIGLPWASQADDTGSGFVALLFVAAATFIPACVLHALFEVMLRSSIGRSLTSLTLVQADGTATSAQHWAQRVLAKFGLPVLCVGGALALLPSSSGGEAVALLLALAVFNAALIIARKDGRGLVDLLSGTRHRADG